MDAVGLKIGQTWFEVSGGSVIKYTLLGYIPVKDIFVLDIDGTTKRMLNDNFSKLTLFDRRTDAVIERDANELTELEQRIIAVKAELADLIAKRDGING